MPGVVLFLILFVFCPGSVYLSSDIGICSKIDSTIKCCSNFKLNKSQTGCVACDPGYYEDCNTPCPPGWYGRLCKTECRYQAQQDCHHVTGCVGGKGGVDDSIVITQTSVSSGGNCTSKSKSGCCINYRRDNKTNTCIACPNGWYNEECRDPCPYPYYGHICGSKCDCSIETCNYVIGCNNTCKNGWYNEECRDRCPYPFYGYRCGSLCDCRNEICHHVTGCNNGNSSTTTTYRESIAICYD